MRHCGTAGHPAGCWRDCCPANKGRERERMCKAESGALIGQLGTIMLQITCQLFCNISVESPFPRSITFLRSLHTLTSIGIYRPWTKPLLLVFSNLHKRRNFWGADLAYILYFDEVFVRRNCMRSFMLHMNRNSSDAATKDATKDFFFWANKGNDDGCCSQTNHV